MYYNFASLINFLSKKKGNDENEPKEQQFKIYLL